MILFLALVGLGFALKGLAAGANAALLRFVALYTVLMTIVYSLIPYKTPWCLLSFYHGIILLAGVGASYLIGLKPVCLGRAMGGLLAIGVGHLGWQAYSGSFNYFSDSRNPHVYAHTGPDIFRIADRVKEVANALDVDMTTPVQVFCPGNDYWPLPWYLRGYQVEYGSAVPDESETAPIVLIQPPMEEALMRKLYELPPPGQKELYMHLFDESGREIKMELRPGVEMRGFVAKSLWDRFERTKAEAESTIQGSQQ